MEDKRQALAILFNQGWPLNVQARKDRMDLWSAGISAYGDSWTYVTPEDTQWGDYSIAWGIRGTNVCQTRALRHVVMECGFLGNRLQNYYVGFAGLNGMGKPICPAIPGRGAPWYPQLAPPRTGRRDHYNVVLLGQVARDTSLMALSSDDEKRPAAYKQWLAGVAKLCKKQGMTVAFRGHPLEPSWSGFVKPEGVLDADAEGWTKEYLWRWADLAIAFSSNSLVEAFMAGVDVLPGHPGSLTWRVRSGLNRPRRFTQGQRKAWLDSVASCQWSVDEIKSGEVWGIIREND